MREPALTPIELSDPRCRWCGATGLAIVLDLGRQPTADLFPQPSDPIPDPATPLRMALCPRCGLAQLGEDPGVVEEPLAIEPQALITQAAQAVAAVTAAGLLDSTTSFAEFDSPHGGSWRALLAAAGASDHTDTGERVDLVVDVFGLMHDADQSGALRHRLARVQPDGILLLQFHTLDSIVRQEQWNALRHGHMAYYSTRVLVAMLADAGWSARRAWSFSLYGGTVLLEARRSDASAPVTPDAELARLLAFDDEHRLRSPAGLAPLSTACTRNARDLREWLVEQRDRGLSVLGYGAASRAVPLLITAGVDHTLLPAVADGSPAKTGRCIPGVRIPIVSAAEIAIRAPDIVLLFVPDLLDEVRAAWPDVEERGGRWAISEPRPHVVAAR